MVIKKVTVKFDNCGECPVQRYSGCALYEDRQIPDNCPIDVSVMMHRYTDFSAVIRGSQGNDDASPSARMDR